MRTLTWLHISDLHFEESDAYNMDVVLGAFLQDIPQLLAEDGLHPDFLAVTGDIAFSGQAEEYELAWHFLDDLRAQLNDLPKEHLFIVPGNHDDWLKRLVPDITFHPSSGILLKDVYLTHGHTWPSQNFLEARHILAGHRHPVIEFRDRLGHRLREPAWFRTRLVPETSAERYGEADPEVILMPPFNELLLGTPLNTPGFTGLGPMLSNGYVDLEASEVYLVDGIHLGRLGALVPPEEGTGGEDG